MDMDTLMSTMAERRGKLKLHLLLRLMLRLILIMDTMDTMDTIPTTDMDICMAERGGKLRLSPKLKLKLKLIPKLIPGVDIMDMDIMDTLMPDMDTTGVKGGIRLQYL